MNGIIAKPVEESDWSDIPGLFKYMVEVMRKADGIGLAAPQIGCFKRFMLIEMPNRSVIGLVNPEVTRLYGDEIRGAEWCSNVPPPGNECVIPRMEIVDVEASLANSPSIRRKIVFRGQQARIIQHEIDHLDGTLFVDRIPEEHKRKAVIEKFNNWKAMRRAQTRKMEGNQDVTTGFVAARSGQPRVS